MCNSAIDVKSIMNAEQIQVETNNFKSFNIKIIVRVAIIGVCDLKLF